MNLTFEIWLNFVTGFRICASPAKETGLWEDQNLWRWISCQVFLSLMNLLAFCMLYILYIFLAFCCLLLLFVSFYLFFGWFFIKSKILRTHFILELWGSLHWKLWKKYSHHLSTFVLFAFNISRIMIVFPATYSSLPFFFFKKKMF